MTRFFKFRFLFIVILILILVACVHAHPETFDQNETADWDVFLAYTGDAFANALVQERMGSINASQILRTNPAHPPTTALELRSIPQCSPPANAAPPQPELSYNSSTMLLDHNTSYNLPLGSALQDPAISDRGLDYGWQPPMQTLPSMDSGVAQWSAWPLQGFQSTPSLIATRGAMCHPPDRARAYSAGCAEFADAQIHSIQPYGSDYGQFTSSAHDTPLMDEFASANDYANFPVHMEADFFPDMNLVPAMDTATDATTVPSFPSAAPHSAVSCHSRTHSTVSNMQGWLRRANSIRDRIMPRVNTTHLFPHPPHNSSSRSPTSASTTGSSRSSGNRRNRQQMVIGQHNYTCDVCTSGFDSQGELTHHRRCHQPYFQRRHVCQQCSKRFQYRKDLTRHLLKHDPNAPRYHCPHHGCKFAVNKGFGRPDHLERHINSQHRLRADTPLRE